MAATAEQLGGRAGGIAGGALGGIIGGFLGPLGVIAGRAIGSAIGRAAGAAAAGALAGMMEDAGDQADEDENTAAGTQERAEEDLCENCRDPRCDELEQKIQDRMHANKRQNPSSDNHGLFPRRLEQMCGQHGPGTEGWDNHTDNLLQDQSNLQRLVDEYESAELDCRNHEDDDLNWDEIDDALGEDFIPNDQQHLGANHPACAGSAEMMRDGRAQEALDRLRYWEFQTPSSGSGSSPGPTS